ncbi:hypothetical protein ACQF36_37440 [Streptomyces sp. Marseille-Q5077]
MRELLAKRVAQGEGEHTVGRELLAVDDECRPACPWLESGS